MYAKWAIKRKNEILPIIQIEGESSERGSERIMLLYALQIIDKALSKYKAYLYPDEPEPDIKKKMVRVYFSMIFSNETELKDFCENIMTIL